MIYIYGKGGSAEKANHYKTICNGYDVLGLDYKGNTPLEEQIVFLDNRLMSIIYPPQAVELET